MGLMYFALSVVFEFGFGWDIPPNHSIALEFAGPMLKGMMFGVGMYYFYFKRREGK